MGQDIGRILGMESSGNLSYIRIASFLLLFLESSFIGMAQDVDNSIFLAANNNFFRRHTIH